MTNLTLGLPVLSAVPTHLSQFFSQSNLESTAATKLMSTILSVQLFKVLRYWSTITEPCINYITLSHKQQILEDEVLDLYKAFPNMFLCKYIQTLKIRFSKQLSTSTSISAWCLAHHIEIDHGLTLTLQSACADSFDADMKNRAKT